MRSKLIWAGAWVCLASALAVAQDPTKVEPKHYKLDFENEHVQVVSVHYGPHEKSALHEHMGGVVVSLTEAHLRFTDENGKVREVYSKPGEARWYPPFKHRVENLGATSYEALYIGVKSKSVAASNGGVGPATGLDEATMDEATKKMVAAYLSASGRP
jgi:quercetin dioxygenase-like cupin family protein